MCGEIKVLLRPFYVSEYIHSMLRFLNDRLLRYLAWLSKASVIPPHFVKFRIIDSYRHSFNLGILIETGTYLGDTISKGRRVFNEVYSVELDKTLFERAREKYSSYPNVKIINGDSSQVLSSIVASLSEPGLFWLDAHYSGGITVGSREICPVVKEIDCILKDTKFEHVLLIDDAHLFTGKKGYPDIETIKNIVNRYKQGWTVYTKDNIVRVHKKK